LQDPQSRATCICVFIQNNAECAVHGSGKGGGGTAAVDFFGLPWSPGIAARNCDTGLQLGPVAISIFQTKKLWCRVPVCNFKWLLLGPYKFCKNKIRTDFPVLKRHTYPPTGITTVTLREYVCASSKWSVTIMNHRTLPLLSPNLKLWPRFSDFVCFIGTAFVLYF
jgi:hypothetical protein